jgi:ABC-2 type transport system ATP-binding protein
MRHHAPHMAPVEVRDLSKHFGKVEAVKHLSFDIQAGRVTGFLGPNGAGKSTTLRALLGLIHPTTGSASFDGKRYEELDSPSAQVGAVLEDASFHPGRSARNHLRVLAATGRHPHHRVDEVLEAVGLTAAADRRVKGYSMGMRQRLAIAAALLGDPEVLILDEPTNGLDPPGIAWMRGMLREQADHGRAVLISSHLLAEVAQSVDDVVVISRGELRAQGPLAQVLGGSDGPATEVVAEDPDGLARALRAAGHVAVREGASTIVHGLGPADVGRIAGRAGLTLLLLTPRARSLEQAFFELTGGEG